MVRDPQAAVVWISNRRSEPGYEQWAAATVERLLAPEVAAFSHLDAPSMAQLLASVGEPESSAAAGVSGLWGREDPEEAVQWAMTLSNPGAQAAAVASAVGAWTLNDPSSAERWTYSLPNGSTRDRALGAYVAQSIASRGEVPARALNAFSSDQARNAAFDGMFYAFRFLGSREPELAMSLANAHIENAELRQRIETDIDRVLDQGIEFPANLQVSVVSAAERP
jgi:hypothetical protein